MLAYIFSLWCVITTNNRKGISQVTAYTSQDGGADVAVEDEGVEGVGEVGVVGEEEVSGCC